VTNLFGVRYDNSSVLLQWDTSPATVYGLTLAYAGTGVVVSTAVFDTSGSSTIVLNLESGVMYQFTINAGNDYGIDYSQGATTDASTNTFNCAIVLQGNANWPQTSSNQTAAGVCQFGFGGNPTRDCAIPPFNGSTYGTFGPISGSCIELPDSLAFPPLVDAYSSYATITWDSPPNATFFTVILGFDQQFAPVNNGLGRKLLTPSVTITDVSPSFVSFRFFSSLSKTGSAFFFDYFLDLQLVPLQTYTVLIYTGNAGGLDTNASTLSFTTPIPPPGNAAVGTVTPTTAAITWVANQYSTWYRVEYIVASGTRRSVSPVVVSTMQTATSVTITGLAPGSSYDVTIFAGSGSTYEPHGATIQVTTLATSGNIAGIGVGGIIGIAVGILFLVLVFAAVLAIFVVRQARRTRQLKASLVDRDMVPFSSLFFFFFFFFVVLLSNSLFCCSVNERYRIREV